LVTRSAAEGRVTTRAQLIWAYLPEGNLTGLDLYRANLTQAILHNATLTNANLAHAELANADLADALAPGQLSPRAAPKVTNRGQYARLMSSAQEGAAGFAGRT
jgi:Pentapeptide repeats (8 copies)